MLKNQSIINVFIVLIAAFLVSTPLMAESKKARKTDRDSSVKEVILSIRAIKGNKLLVTEDEKKQPREVAKNLEDLNNKLTSFDFQSFRLVSEQTLTIPVKKKTTIFLTERTVLNVRPLYTEEKRVGLWIKWTDSSGDRTLIDTRMHFNAGEVMLAGTNCKNNKALILAISAVPNTPAAAN